MRSITPGQAKERCFICNCWVRAATDTTMITDLSAGKTKRIYKVISFKFVVPSPNSPSTHRDAEPSHIPGQEATGVWDWPGGTWAEKHSKPQSWRGVLALPEERKGKQTTWLLAVETRRHSWTDPTTFILLARSFLKV